MFLSKFCFKFVSISCETLSTENITALMRFLLMLPQKICWAAGLSDCSQCSLYWEKAIKSCQIVTDFFFDLRRRSLNAWLKVVQKALLHDIRIVLHEKILEKSPDSQNFPKKYILDEIFKFSVGHAISLR